MKQFFSFPLLIGFVLFASCKQEIKNNTKLHTVTLIDDRIKIDIPDTWKNQNPNSINFYIDTLNETYYGIEPHGDHCSITRIDKNEEDLDVLLKNELRELHQVKQPWSKVIETKIDHKNKTIAIKTTLHLKNQHDFTEIYLIVLKNERFYVFFAGHDNPEFRRNVERMIKSIVVL
ncbi:MAG: hypothetical protein U0X41_12330 [Chitinophagales bacterium]